MARATSATLKNEDIAPIRDFLLDKLRREGDGITLQELIKAALDEGYSEKEVRRVIRLQEETGNISADWDWKYHIIHIER